jgi:hypothetical protein
VISLERAAFGDRPDLDPGVPAEPRERWLAAVVLGGQGRYAAAAALLGDLITGRDPTLAAYAASTLASHRRQLGGHQAARALDAEGLRRLAGRLPEEGPAASDVLLGLAADALGVGRLDEARRLVAAADRLPAVGWRGTVRHAWVSAEIELSAARASVAAEHAERAAELAADSGSVRHRIKSALVLGAALGAAGQGSRARPLVAAAHDEAVDLGLLSLVWPGALILAELDPTRGGEHCRCAAVALHSVLRRADPVGRLLAERSPWVPRPAGPTG